MNGQDYTPETEKTLFTFIGSRTVLSYWPYIIGLLLGVLALIALIMCCTAFYHPAPVPEEPLSEARGKKHGQGNLGAKPHTLRDEFGLYRVRSIFPDKSPGPGGNRSTLVPGSNRPSQMVSPQPAPH